MRRFALLACVLSIAVASGAAAQVSSSRFILGGTIVDPTGAPLAGAVIVATSDAGRPSASVATNQTGTFALALERGKYRVTISAPGFHDAVREITAADERSESVRIVLELAGVQENVSVSVHPGYEAAAITSATKTPTPLNDVPQSVTVVTQQLVKDQLMTSIGDVVRYVPGVTYHQGENNRDQIIMRGNSSSADFFVDGVRDDVQYYRDLYNLERIEALKGPNAMIFGRGGGGGVIHRVLKQAGSRPLRSADVQLGGDGNRRVTADFNQPLSEKIAIRLNGVFENSDSFRDSVNLERAGINPTLTFTPGNSTRIATGYEYLRDTRVADRGISSFQGAPLELDPSTYFGNPSDSHVRTRAHTGWFAVEHRIGAFTIRERATLGGFDRFYQNYVPGAVSSDQSQVSLTAYNNATQRNNAFSQTDVTYSMQTGAFRHTFVAGIEVGRQHTDNFRNTGFFNNDVTSIRVPLIDPTTDVPVTYRQSLTDADNHVLANVAAGFAQDQVEISQHVQLVGGLRYDRFDLKFHNNRNGDDLDRVDYLTSPRAGVVYKPIRPLSFYGSYSVSYLPGSGDQFSSLTVITEQLEPEKFNNYELGAKWDALSLLSVTGAIYRLDRTNTRATDPNDPTRIVQTGRQRTNGVEFGVNGRVTSAWNVAGGYAYQDAFVTSATVAARAGAEVGQVPRHTFSLWNNYEVGRRFGAALGLIHRSSMFAAIDDTVTLPGYTRADAAVYVPFTKNWRLQANVENLFDAKYFVNADSNTNISPGSPRVARIALRASF
jgi:catecholate siderophore receptor